MYYFYFLLSASKRKKRCACAFTYVASAMSMRAFMNRKWREWPLSTVNIQSTVPSYFSRWHEVCWQQVSFPTLVHEHAARTHQKKYNTGADATSCTTNNFDDTTTAVELSMLRTNASRYRCWHHPSIPEHPGSSDLVQSMLTAIWWWKWRSNREGNEPNSTALPISIAYEVHWVLFDREITCLPLWHDAALDGLSILILNHY